MLSIPLGLSMEDTTGESSKNDEEKDIYYF